MLSTKGIEFLQEAISTKNKLLDYEKSIKIKEREAQEAEKQLFTLKANIEHDIKKSVAAARRNIENMYEEKSDDIEKDMKSHLDARAKNKNNQVEKRIQEKNSKLVIENSGYEEYINSLAKKCNVNFRSNSKLYYTFFVPRGFKETVISGILILFLMLVPLIAIYYLANMSNILYFLIAFAVGFTLLHMIKTGYVAKNLKYLYESRKIYDKIAINERTMIINANKIKNDPDESYYNLAQYDERIEDYKKRLDTILAEKENKLEEFDLISAKKIENDIREANKQSISDTESENEKRLDDIQELKDYKEKLVRHIVINFDNVLGEEFKDIKKIRQLINIIEQGKANNVEQAIAEYYEED